MFDNYSPATHRCHPNLSMRDLKQRMTFSHRQRSMGADAPALQAPGRSDGHDERSNNAEHKQREAQACYVLHLTMDGLLSAVAATGTRVRGAWDRAHGCFIGAPCCAHRRVR
jgi:hypothetical protein